MNKYLWTQFHWIFGLYRYGGWSGWYTDWAGRPRHWGWYMPLPDLLVWKYKFFCSGKASKNHIFWGKVMNFLKWKQIKQTFMWHIWPKSRWWNNFWGKSLKNCTCSLPSAHLSWFYPRSIHLWDSMMVGCLFVRLRKSLSFVSRWPTKQCSVNWLNSVNDMGSMPRRSPASISLLQTTPRLQ